MMQLVIFKQAPIRIPKSSIKKLFNKIMAEESDNKAQGKINLILTTDKNLQKLNKRYRGRDKATDVLSFNLEKLPLPSEAFGEIYISVETSKRQAIEYGTTWGEEFLRLICHGLLHLLGYDHVKAGERRKMEKREKHFLKSLMVS